MHGRTHNVNLTCCTAIFFACTFDHLKMARKKLKLHNSAEAFGLACSRAQLTELFLMPFFSCISLRIIGEMLHSIHHDEADGEGEWNENDTKKNGST